MTDDKLNELIDDVVTAAEVVLTAYELGEGESVSKAERELAEARTALVAYVNAELDSLRQRVAELEQKREL